MVLESSARSRFLGMTRAASGQIHNYKVVSLEASFRGASIIQVISAAVVHAAHAAHPTHAAHSAAAAPGGLGFLLRLFGNHRFGGEEEAGDAGGVLQRGASDFGG